MGQCRSFFKHGGSCLSSKLGHLGSEKRVVSFPPQASRHREGTALDTHKLPATLHSVFPAFLEGRTPLSPPISQRGLATSSSNTARCPGPAVTPEDLLAFSWGPRLKFSLGPSRSGIHSVHIPCSLLLRHLPLLRHKSIV